MGYASRASRVNELIVFCDAIEKAFGTAAYPWSSVLNPVLLTSRARPAPVKMVTVVKLELRALLLKARLAA